MKMIKDADTAELREERINNLTTAGLSRADAELVDMKMKDVVTEMLTVMEERVSKFADARPELGSALLAVVLESGHAAMCGSLQQFKEQVIKQTAGFQMVEIENPEELFAFLEELFGPLGPPDKDKMH